MKRNMCIGIALLGTICLLLGPRFAAAGPGKPTAAPAKPSSALAALQTAYAAESHAQALYLGYAEKAKSEKYLKAAKLFRALAKSEGIRIAGIEKMIQGMGATPTAPEAKLQIGSTKQNLESASAMITEATTVAYPKLLEQVAQEKNQMLMMVLGGTKAIRANHLILLNAASADLKALKADGDYFVCSVCGNTVAKMDFEFCAICKQPSSVFSKVE
jgi:rubrerythrin